jgi:hypothetical protein
MSTSRSARSVSRARSPTAPSPRPRAAARGLFAWLPRWHRSSRDWASEAAPRAPTTPFSLATSRGTSTRRRCAAGSSPPVMWRSCDRCASTTCATPSVAAHQPRESRPGPGMDGATRTRRRQCATCTTRARRTRRSSSRTIFVLLSTRRPLGVIRAWLLCRQLADRKPPDPRWMRGLRPGGAAITRGRAAGGPGGGERGAGPAARRPAGVAPPGPGAVSPRRRVLSLRDALTARETDLVWFAA